MLNKLFKMLKEYSVANICIHKGQCFRKSPVFIGVWCELIFGVLTFFVSVIRELVFHR